MAPNSYNQIPTPLITGDWPTSSVVEQDTNCEVDIDGSTSTSGMYYNYDCTFMAPIIAIRIVQYIIILWNR